MTCSAAAIAAIAKPGGTVWRDASRLRLAALPPTTASWWQSSSPSQRMLLITAPASAALAAPFLTEDRHDPGAAAKSARFAEW